MRAEAAITRVAVASYVIPTEQPESDGTFAWRATTLVLARIEAGGREGLGYGYADTATARLIADLLGPLLEGRDALALNARRLDCLRAVRNLGRHGIAAMAISILDTALWDLKGQLLGQPLLTLLGAARERIDAYGSGGFTSYTDAQLDEQLGGWADQGFLHVKMKVGREPGRDPQRVALARRAIGPRVRLMVDANGAYSRKQALALAETFAGQAVDWFEEPVSSDDVAGLRLLRDRGPAGMAIAAGEYGYDLPYFRRLLDAGAVDVLQADATRCGGVSGWLGASALCEAYGLPLSAHCAPALHAALCCAAPAAVHLEYFHDHARIEALLFDGAPAPAGGAIAAQADRPGLGLVFKETDARCFNHS